MTQEKKIMKRMGTMLPIFFIGIGALGPALRSGTASAEGTRHTASMPAAAGSQTIVADLDQMLKELDQDRSRQLTRIGGTANVTGGGAYSASNVEKIFYGLKHASEPVLIVLGHRDSGNAPFAVERVLKVAPQSARASSASSTPAKTSFRSVYTTDVGAGDRWNRLLTEDSSWLKAKPETVTADAAINALTGSKSAAFVFFASHAQSGKPSRIDQLYVVPDTLKINITGTPSSKVADAGGATAGPVVGGASTLSRPVPSEAPLLPDPLPSAPPLPSPSARAGQPAPHGKPLLDTPEGRAEAQEEERARAASFRPPSETPPFGPINPPPLPRSH